MRKTVLMSLVLGTMFCLAPAGRPSAGEAIVVYTALEDDEYPGYLELFKKQRPDIEVKIVRDSTGIVTAKLLAEKNNPRADVVWGLAATGLILAEKRGMLEPYAPKRLEKVNPMLRDAANPPAWVGIKAWETGIVVNTIELKKLGLPMPGDYRDLLNPAYQGLIAMPNPASSGTGYLTVSALIQLMGEREAWNYLDQLHRNIMQYTHSGSKPAKMAGQGEAVIGISFGYRGLKQKANGEPVETVWPASGAGWDLEANALVRKAKIKDAAKTFLDFALGEDVMRMYASIYPITSIESGLPVPEGYPADPVSLIIKNDLAKAASERDRVLAEWSKRYDGKSESR
ncbi:MAG: putative 2-aminoethylphosphonate ABC transporter substrate-binding protein [Planctomycetota bacterium]|nr:putative 2-aminoethylphosphonate ABC transporter substrate-binding protein [Planctomycetota bacterium]MDR1520131.1 putative 2-aminoethylphosphonate ABC transporter substrate-binding protein [Planctomycetota bacterium]